MRFMTVTGEVLGVRKTIIFDQNTFSVFDLVGAVQELYKGKSFSALQIRRIGDEISFKDVKYCPSLPDSETKVKPKFTPDFLKECETFEHLLQHIRMIFPGTSFPLLKFSLRFGHFRDQ